ncbi:Serine/threonine-protein phosphatase 6 regulatory subunit 3 [Globodera pallida]|nr:Serine/threonine-protein phosphatase 6 regulatory subunit 3 [Globodera pallida]
MFWSTMAAEERELDKKLKSESSDLKTILDDVHCLQEIRNSHEPLMNFLKREDIFKEMITAILMPLANDDGEVKAKDKYRFAHLCCEAVCIGARDFYPEFEKRPELVVQLTEFFNYNSSALNPLVVSFYSRLVISFLSAEAEKFLDLLEESEFLERCLMALDNCSLFELLCTIANCMPDPCFRERIKMWYVNKGFAHRMLENLRPDQPSTIHENTVALWVEFVKALRDFQYNVEQCFDPLLDSIQSEETILELLKLMFPQTSTDDANENGTLKFNSSVVSNGVLVLNALMETNHVRNAPSWLLTQENISKEFLESNQQLNGSFDSTDGGSSITGQQILMDPKRLTESHCAEHATEIMELIIDSLNKGPDELLGDQLCGCMQLLINLTNTNFLPTHFELLRAFSAPSDPLRQLFESVKATPTRSIFNAQLTTFIMHILYSTTGEQKPLIDFVIRDFNIAALIRQALPTEEDSFLTDDELGTDRLTMIAKRSFFYQLANRLLQAQQTSPNAEYIEQLIKELPDTNDWDEFCSSYVQSFVDQNRSEKVLSISTTNRSSNAIEIDELPDDNITPLPNLILK